jgi:hypothetical protein
MRDRRLYRETHGSFDAYVPHGRRGRITLLGSTTRACGEELLSDDTHSAEEARSLSAVLAQLADELDDLNGRVLPHLEAAVAEAAR